ncbi:hypothetical protein AAFC00_002660 [Neodothiora populina]|uniref:Zn(2)-C6 fungal-type domain-containing protein n=1 Tax=Neodothiora populina TaxID=2781224 RepID=A0ABR3P7U3_9PEZI
MHHRRSDASNTRDQLPPLAPRGSQTSPVLNHANTRTVSSPRAARPRLSHRSRAGCWTCRKRKVKCDEVHPKCGPCVRLNKDCDWEFRWKFDDVTTNTQNKYTNVSTAGNSVWDPHAPIQTTSSSSSPSLSYDGLPSFANLTNDQDRERKAGSRAPGTYNVIVNPRSFASLPEYGVHDPSRPRTHSSHSIHSGRDGLTSPSASVSPGGSRGQPGSDVEDPDIVVLPFFEDVSVTTPASLSFSTDRRTSLPETMQHLEITLNPRGSSLPSRNHATGINERNERLMVHYRGFIAKRIMPLGKHFYLDHGAGQEDPIVLEARTFLPLYHAICAVSLLSLALKGQQQLLPEAFQHYHQAISSSLTTASDLSSDRLLYLHFLLLIYDICYATQASNNPYDGFNMNMWSQHMHHLIRIAKNRKGKASGELQDYLLWYILYLDTHAHLGGNGSGDFARAFLDGEIFLPDWRDIKGSARGLRTQPVQQYDEVAAFVAIYNFSHGACILNAKLAVVSQRIRAEVTSYVGRAIDPATIANWQHTIAQLRAEYHSYWARGYPSFLSADPAQATIQLPALARIIFQFSYLQLYTQMLYLDTSMYPGQRLHNTLEVREDVSRRCTTIIAMTTSVVEAQDYDQHHIVFPIFMAGFATEKAEVKVHAINLLNAMEGTGISRNVTRSRELLVSVCEEQEMCAMAGAQAEEVDWITLAKSKGIAIVNFGL